MVAAPHTKAKAFSSNVNILEKYFEEIEIIYNCSEEKYFAIIFAIMYWYKLYFLDVFTEKNMFLLKTKA